MRGRTVDADHFCRGEAIPPTFRSRKLIRFLPPGPARFDAVFVGFQGGGDLD
jgi:hypothetical protein